MDERLNALTSWAADFLGVVGLAPRPASADASFRRYFRISAEEESFILMDAPPKTERIESFLTAAARLHEIGLNVPSVIASDIGRGFAILSDLGETRYLDALTEQSAERLYGDAIRALIVLQAATVTGPNVFPPYDAALLVRELSLFPEWFLHRHLGQPVDEHQQRNLQAVFSQLVDAALAQPRVWVHRDFHSRNLMLTAHNNPGILDFQDAVCGPIAYDVVSLLRDCYIAWSEEKVLGWVRSYHALARQSGLEVGDDDDRFLQWFDWMGVQRHLKAVGIFARLHHRDGKAGYMQDIPRVLRYLEQVSRRYPALAPLHDIVDPLLERRASWMP